MSNLPVSSSSTAPIYWMALGTFAIGTESFMIVPLLPKIATNLRSLCRRRGSSSPPSRWLLR